MPNDTVDTLLTLPPSASFRPIESGSPSSPIWIIGEAPGGEEIAQRRPFVGASGQLLTQLLLETGFARHQCFITNVCHERPPEQVKNGKVIRDDISTFFLTKTEARRRLVSEVLGRYPLPPVVSGRNHLINLLALHRPQLILAFGNTALWALTGHTGILKWRGSVLTATETPQPFTKLIPTAHPAAVLREYPLRNIVLQDLRRAKRESAFPEVRKPAWQFIVRPTADTAIDYLNGLFRRLTWGRQTFACDIETRRGQIACVGIAQSETEAICIPLMCVERSEGYFSPDEERSIILLLRAVLSHPNARIVFQNGAYDLQYFAKQYGFLPRIQDDTMLMQHVCFPGLRKGLDFLSSLYCRYHRYWKDDGKTWDDSINEEQLWTYNCEDCVRTFECWQVLTEVVRARGLTDQYHFQMQELFPIVLRMMLRGIAFDSDRRASVQRDLEAFRLNAQDWLDRALGHTINVESSAQMQRLFYEDLRVPTILHRKTKRPTLDDEALDRIARQQPLLALLIQHIRDIRSANTALENVLTARVSPDGRSRSTINMAGAETFRFSSSEDAFGFGFNMQNITKGDEA